MSAKHRKYSVGDVVSVLPSAAGTETLVFLTERITANSFRGVEVYPITYDSVLDEEMRYRYRVVMDCKISNLIRGS